MCLGIPVFEVGSRHLEYPTSGQTFEDLKRLWLFLLSVIHWLDSSQSGWVGLVRLVVQLFDFGFPFSFQWGFIHLISETFEFKLGLAGGIDIGGLRELIAEDDLP